MVIVARPATPSRAEQLFTSLRSVVGLGAAGAGIFAALLYLAGRSFASGYFGAMNIPDYQLTFSLWEYGAVSWLPLFMFPVVMLGLSSLLAGIFSRLADYLSPAVSILKDRLHHKIQRRLRLPKAAEASQRTKIWFGVANAAWFLLLLFFMTGITLYVATVYGTWNARLYLLQNAPQVEIVSTAPLALDTDSGSAISYGGKQYFEYADLHLLTFNEGTYYLFRALDPDSCKPARVYIVRAADALRVDLLPAVSMTSDCQPRGLLEDLFDPQHR